MNQNSQGIQTLEHASRILEEIKHNGQPITLTALSQKVGMSKNNLKKYLVSFVKLNFVTFDEERKTYDLGSKLIELGLYTLNKYSILSVADPFMLRIKHDLKLSSALAIWTKNGPVISKYQSGGQSINVEIALGYYPPLLKSSIGRCFASFLPANETDDLMQQEIDNDGFDKAQIETDLEKIKKAGFASRNKNVDDLPGNLSIAAPIFNHQGRIIAAICVLGFAYDLNTGEQSDEVQALKNMTQEISDQLTHSS